MISTGLMLFITILSYVIGLWIFRWSKNNPLLHPLLVAGLVVIGCLVLFDIPQQTYQQGNQLTYYLLSIATVTLGVPLYNQLGYLRRYSWRILLPIVFGGTLAPLFAWITVYLLDTPLNIQMTMLVKSITTPLALDASEFIGGIASLAAVIVILTGVVVAIFSPLVFQLVNLWDPIAQGVTYGTVGHAVGTAKALSVNEVCGAFSSLALCLNGLVTAVVLPLLFS